MRWLLSRFRCWRGRHDLRVVQTFGYGARRVKCRCCGGDWGMHDGVKAFVPWDGELEEMYATMGFEIREPFGGVGGRFR